jgi:ABC-type microcin C transport system permease subunit YejE
MRNIFNKFDKNGFSTPESNFSPTFKRLNTIDFGLAAILLLGTVFGFIMGLFFGEVCFIWKKSICTSSAETPYLFLILMLLDGLAAFFSAAYIWIRVLGK